MPTLAYNYKTSTTDTAQIQELTATPGGTTRYSYGPLGWLTTATAANSHYEYNYDGAGNRTAETVNSKGSEGGEASYYTYSPGNLLECQQKTKGACTSGQEVTHDTYDEAGELTNITPKLENYGLTLTYNAAQQTNSITPNGGAETKLEYSGSGQDDLTKLGTTTLQNSLLGLTKEEAAKTSYYARTPNGQLVDERTPTGSYNPLYDAQGDIIALANATTGDVERTFRYGPYGEDAQSEGTQTIPYPFGYKGGYQLSDGPRGRGAQAVGDAIMHFGARFLDEATGRWTQPDPAATITSYEFAGDDPINKSDPSGKASVEEYGESCGKEALNGAIASAPGGFASAAKGAASGCLTGVATKLAGEVFGEEGEEIAGAVGEVATLGSAAKSSKDFYSEE